MNQKKTKYKLENISSKERIEHRKVLYKLFNNRPIPDEHLLISLGLFLRSSQLSKILYINELFQKILQIPGVIMEFGTWYGQNMVLFENLRAIYEPFNFDRKIIGFDTFTGYPGISTKDKPSETIKEGSYKLNKDYDKYLQDLLDYHEKNNVLYTKRKHELIKGDISNTLEIYLDKHPETVIALAYLDLALYKPTKEVLKQIKKHLIKGSVIALDELNNPDYPGETLALKETWGLDTYKIYKAQLAAGRSYIIIE